MIQGLSLREHGRGQNYLLVLAPLSISSLLWLIYRNGNKLERYIALCYYKRNGIRYKWNMYNLFDHQCINLCAFTVIPN